MSLSKGKVKENIEIRFLLTPSAATKLLKTWRREDRRLEPYSFTDYYFTGGRSPAKIRRWNSPHTPKVEIIFHKRKFGVKTERSQDATSLEAASKELKSLGFKPYLRIVKERAWVVSKKGMPTYALEFVPGLGWTGEIEVPLKNRKKIPSLVKDLRHTGTIRATRKSMLQLMEEKLEAKRTSVD